MTEKQKLIQYLRSHPALKITTIEQEAGIPSRTLQRVLDNERDLPDKHIPGLKKVLIKYGFKK